jgi:hypothetical protein
MKSCWYISATGNPAASVPCGFTPEGLPVGLQIVGRNREDFGVLQMAHAFEQATGLARSARLLPRRGRYIGRLAEFSGSRQQSDSSCPGYNPYQPSERHSSLTGADFSSEAAPTIPGARFFRTSNRFAPGLIRQSAKRFRMPGGNGQNGITGADSKRFPYCA